MAFLRKNKELQVQKWEEVPNEQKKGLVARFRGAVNNTLDTAQDQVTLRAQAKYYDHWAQICGGTIDWNNPTVQCESVLCNIAVLQLLTNQSMTVEERRNKAQSHFSEIGWQCYLNGRDEQGKPYTDLEQHSFKWWATHKKSKS